MINVDLGQNIRASQFRGQAYPQPPKSYTARNVDLTFDCDFSNADVDISLVGTRDTQQQGFASSSPDISVIVANQDGTIIPPQSNAGYVTVGSDKVSNTLHLKAWPPNSGTAATPEASSYTATATIMVPYR
ncbi:TPA: fimbrial protein [Enterobacter hormaechei subsp. steigerwaltii]|nr:fimbrial protein [Enterobacter hormaechei subsp. steigerwaltii]